MKGLQSVCPETIMTRSSHCVCGYCGWSLGPGLATPLWTCRAEHRCSTCDLPWINCSLSTSFITLTLLFSFLAIWIIFFECLFSYKQFTHKDYLLLTVVESSTGSRTGANFVERVSYLFLILYMFLNHLFYLYPAVIVSFATKHGWMHTLRAWTCSV